MAAQITAQVASGVSNSKATKQVNVNAIDDFIQNNNGVKNHFLSLRNE